VAARLLPPAAGSVPGGEVHAPRLMAAMTVTAIIPRLRGPGRQLVAAHGLLLLVAVRRWG
jgi:hypothetical protein